MPGRYTVVHTPSWNCSTHKYRSGWSVQSWKMSVLKRPSQSVSTTVRQSTRNHGHRYTRSQRWIAMRLDSPASWLRICAIECDVARVAAVADRESAKEEVWTRCGAGAVAGIAWLAACAGSPAARRPGL